MCFWALFPKKCKAHLGLNHFVGVKRTYTTE